MLERVGARERLDAGERAALERAIAAASARAALAEAEEALRDGRGDRRRRAFAVAREPGVSVRMRLGAAAASAAPGLARRWLQALLATVAARAIRARRSAAVSGEVPRFSVVIPHTSAATSSYPRCRP